MNEQEMYIQMLLAANGRGPRHRPLLDLNEPPSTEARAGILSGDIRNYQRTMGDYAGDVEGMARSAVESGVEGGMGVAQHIANTPQRVTDLSNRMADGGHESMDPYEVGQASVDGGMMPLFGAIGGIPRNAAGQIGAGGAEEFNPLKWAAGGAAGVGAVTVGNDIYHDEFPGFSSEYMMDRLGPNMGYGALAGAGAAVGGALLTGDPMPGRRLAVTPQPGGGPKGGPHGPTTPVSPGYSGSQAPPSGGQGPASVGPRPGPASGTPNAPQNTGNPSSLGSSGGLQRVDKEYTEDHRRHARHVLHTLLSDESKTVTPASLVSELTKTYNQMSMPVPSALRDRARETLRLIYEQNPNFRKSIGLDKADLTVGIYGATGKPGTLALPGAIGGGLFGLQEDEQ